MIALYTSAYIYHCLRPRGIMTNRDFKLIFTYNFSRKTLNSEIDSILKHDCKIFASRLGAT